MKDHPLDFERETSRDCSQQFALNHYGQIQCEVQDIFKMAKYYYFHCVSIVEQLELCSESTRVIISAFDARVIKKLLAHLTSFSKSGLESSLVQKLSSTKKSNMPVYLDGGDITGILASC